MQSCVDSSVDDCKSTDGKNILLGGRDDEETGIYSLQVTATSEPS